MPLPGAEVIPRVFGMQTHWTGECGQNPGAIPFGKKSGVLFPSNKSKKINKQK